jgi:hypothetical protein
MPAERQPVDAAVDDHRIAVREVSAQQVHRERVEDPALDRAAQRARAVRGIVPLVDQIAQGVVGRLDRELSLGQAPSEVGELDRRDVRQVAPVERVEDDDLVDAT